MEIADLINPSRILPRVRASSKKQVLQEIAAHAGRCIGRDEKEIFDTLLDRERLGSTGIGHGIAVPHGKLPSLDHIYGFFARLETPVDFEAIDGLPVDLVFMLLAPVAAGADHLKALARVSRLLRNQTTCEKLRGTDQTEALYALLTESAAPHAA
jgi:PTS system nitrogen regulatory IIA component